MYVGELSSLLAGPKLFTYYNATLLKLPTKIYEGADFIFTRPRSGQ